MGKYNEFKELQRKHYLLALQGVDPIYLIGEATPECERAILNEDKLSELPQKRRKDVPKRCNSRNTNRA